MKNKTRGFTLIEIMIAVVIVAILAAIAVPSYNSQIQKSRRSDATAALTAAASAQERWYFQFNGYASDVDDIGGASSPEEFYTISINNNSGVDECVGGGAVRFNCFILTATPVVGLSQASDATCTTFTLSNLGVKGATGSVPNLCW